MTPPKPNARFSFRPVILSRQTVFFFFFSFWAWADTANWRRRQGASWPLSAARPRATCGPGGRRPGTSRLVADVLKMRSLGVLVMLIFPLGVCECVLFSLKSPVFCFYSFVTLFTIFSKWSKGL